MDTRCKVGLFASSRWPVVFSSIVLVFLLTLQATGVVFAEGSRDLYPAGASGSRADTEWRASSYGPVGPPDSTIRRRTLLKVFANQNEFILMGSSAVGVLRGTASGNILVYNPGLVSGTPGRQSIPAVASYSCNVQRAASGNPAQGQITSRIAELAGPDTIIDPASATPGGAVSGGYVPCFYQAPVSGIYDLVIHGPSGFSSDVQGNPTGQISLSDPNNFNAAQATNIAAWDVTVRSALTSTTDLNGRLFTYYLALFTGGNGRPINSTIYLVTRDGFQYQTDMRGMDPFGFVYYGNRLGFYDHENPSAPHYNDVLSAVGAANANQLTQLQGHVELQPPEYPIFFNRPDPAALTALGIPTTPTAPSINILSFNGTAGSNKTFYGTGGAFSFTSNVGGIYQIVISRDGLNFDPTNPINRALIGTAALGANTLTWDGRDNSSNWFPVGDNYEVQSALHAGELHMVLLDVENSASGGPTYMLLNPPGGTCPLAFGCTTAFYDDRGYQTPGGGAVGTPGSILCGQNPPSVPAAVENGFDSRSTQRAFGSVSGGNSGVPCTGSFGDTKGLDLWTYFPSPLNLSVLSIIPPDNPPRPPRPTSPSPISTSDSLILPVTGFSPDVVTILPAQPAGKTYFEVDNLWLEIPSLGVRQSIVGVPRSSDGWDVAWLGSNIGYLEGTAFPTWAGNTTLTGHVYDANGKPGPFVDLGKMWWGQQVIIHAWNQRYIYEVRTVNRWVKPNDASLILKHEEYDWITLVTCRGYEEKSASYRYRVIVRAVLVKVEADR